MKLIMENWRKFVQEAGFERPDWDYRQHPESDHSPRNHPLPIQEDGNKYKSDEGEVVKLIVWRGAPHKLVCTDNQCLPIKISQEEYNEIANTWEKVLDSID